MNARDALLVALPAVLVGSAVGFLFGRLEGRPTISAAAGPARAVPPARGRSPEPRLALPEPAALPGAEERAPAEATDATALTHVSRSEVERALARIEAPSVGAELGTGTITGSVVDATGAPIPGVTIIAQEVDWTWVKDPGESGAAAPTDVGLEEFLREGAERWARERAGRRRAVTDEGGAFALTNLSEESSYAVSAYLEGSLVKPLRDNDVVSPGQSLRFQVHTLFTVPIELVRSDGSRPERGVVGIDRGGREELYRWTSAAPELSLPAAHVTLRGYAGELPGGSWSEGQPSTHASEATMLDVAANGAAPVVLRLEPRLGIRGRVVDNGEEAIGTLVVRLLPVVEGVPVDEKALAESDHRTRVNGGRFAVLDLEPGTYSIGLSSWNGPLLASEIVTVEDGIVERDLVMREPDATRHLVVRAYGPSGAPLEGLEFQWRAERENGSSSGGIAGRRTADGSYWIVPRDDFLDEWTADTKHTLTITHDLLGQRVISLSEGQREVEVIFEEPVTIVVELSNYATSPYVGRLQVTFQAPGVGRQWHGWGRGDGVPSSDGIVRSKKLAPGVWTVVLSLKSGEWETEQLASREVEVSSGERTVTLAIPIVQDVVVVAPNLEEDTWLSLRPADAGEEDFFDRRSTNLDAEGRAVFEGVPPGTYELDIFGVESREIVVPCGEIYVDARPPDCLRVAIGDLEGLLYRSGLRADDLVIGVDGEEFGGTSPDMFDFLGEGEVRLLVLRGDETFEVPLALPDDFDNWMEELGGMLSPAHR